MNDFETIKQLYANHRRAVWIFSESRELIWSNDMAADLGLSKEISENISGGRGDEFDIASKKIIGRCEIRRLENHDSALYIAELFESKNINRHEDGGLLFNSTVRESINRISSSLQNMFYELDDKAKEHLPSLNSGMLGCYDALRCVELSDDLLAVESIDYSSIGTDDIIDYSNVIKVACNQISEVAAKINLNFENSVEAGIFGKNVSRLILSAVMQVVLISLRRNPFSKLYLELKRSGDFAVLTVSREKTKRSEIDESLLRKYVSNGNIDALSKRYIESFAKRFNGRICLNDDGDIIGFELPTCSPIDLTFSSGDEGYYRGNRFSKCRILFSSIYDIDFFEE